ncbi:hypothetical protein BDZ45DRAFT_744292 [Acephala macrosclerotiorum]|nr:hypothetical protein BDZ45DRAFT_744292 [Acephala macrosclerotiorum]
MGNKNNRRKSSSGSMSMSVSSLENLSPKYSVVDSSVSEQYILGTGNNNDGMENLAIQAPSPLKFKSFKTGTLLTNNGQASLTAVPDMSYILSPSKLRKNATQSKLRPTTPAFIPKPKIPTGPKNPDIPCNHYTRAQANANALTERAGSSNFQRVQNLVQAMRAAGQRQISSNCDGYGGDAIQQPDPQRDLRLMSIPGAGGVSYGSSGLYTGAGQCGIGCGNSGYGNKTSHNNGYYGSTACDNSYGNSGYGAVGSGRPGNSKFGYGYPNASLVNAVYESSGYGAVARGMPVYSNAAHSNYGQANSAYGSGHSYDSPGPSNAGSGYATPTQGDSYSSYSNTRSQAPIGMDRSMGSGLAMASMGARSVSTGTVIHRPELRTQLSRSPSPARLPVKPMRVFMARSDRTMKDVIVTVNKFIRNAVQIHQQYLPDGLAYDTIRDIYNPKVYDFFEDFKTNFTEEQKKDFLGRKAVEIRVLIPEDYENLVVVEEKPKITKVTIQANTKGKDKETEGDDKKYSFSTNTNAKRTVIDTLEDLGPEFCNNAKRVTIVLVFPANPTSTPLNTAINLAPAEGAPINSPTFKFLDQLCHYLDENFTSITNLTVILRVPSNTRMPLSMPQLYHALPFYDLKFTNWYLMYQPDNLTNPLRVEGWCMSMLDRERDRVVLDRNKKKREEKRKIDNAIFVRTSAYVPEVKVKVAQGEMKKMMRAAK